MASPSRTTYSPNMRFPHVAPAPVVHRVPSNLDEGFSEETQSQPGSDSGLEMAHELKDSSERASQLIGALESLSMEERLAVLRQAAATLSAKDQLAFANGLLALLPNWAKQSASAHLDSLMFFDPVKYLPYEMVANILGNLNPKDLLSASGVNRAWRERAQDEELWRKCFVREGWSVDTSKLRRYESEDKARRVKRTEVGRRDGLKRRREQAFTEGEQPRAGPSNSESVPTASSTEPSDSDTMEGLELGSAPPTLTAEALSSMRPRRSSTASAMSYDSTLHTPATDFKLAPTVFQIENEKQDGSDPKTSWAYLYKQRRRLERNWEEGKYKMFALPHPQHQFEGHEECVYTIQHTNEYLVSGSRDKTIRIWNLDDCRLKCPPLRGHEASVLCLQFDQSPENDLIVSGGSDSWVIFWKFSTGELIKKVTDAHQESVLNLRFDDRYLVTCSKDKSIKLWNRRAITKDSPIIPLHTIERYSELGPADIIQEHSLLATLNGHHAAVNAVMIHNNTIVSASGDRTIKAWDIHTGKAERTYSGHTKGIACVQYDGRRIVSGSSDNSVRIFDAHTQAVVATLTGHSNLVRTVQARFGDLETRSDEELLAESKSADRRFLSAYSNDPSRSFHPRRGAHNAGSNKPEKMLAYGTKVPPGGGGGRWAKIVSGSYDETIIIWRQDKDGQWTARQRLSQGFLLNPRAAHRRAVPLQALPMPANLHNINAQLGPPQHPNAAAHQALVQAQSFLQQANRLVTGQAPLPHGQGQQVQQLANQHQQLHTQVSTLQHAAGPAAPQPQPAAAPHPNIPHASLAAVAAVQAAAPAVPATAQGPGHGHGGQNAANAHPRGSESSNRVFKLQFDARRIICCSQNKVIVGWDFADGDEEVGRVGGWCVETF